MIRTVVFDNVVVTTPEISTNTFVTRCHVEPQRPFPGSCTCQGPMGICIPPGEHIHLSCPVHGDTVLHGNEITC